AQNSIVNGLAVGGFSAAWNGTTVFVPDTPSYTAVWSVPFITTPGANVTVSALVPLAAAPRLPVLNETDAWVDDTAAAPKSSATAANRNRDNKHLTQSDGDTGTLPSFVRLAARTDHSRTAADQPPRGGRAHE